MLQKKQYYRKCFKEIKNKNINLKGYKDYHLNGNSKMKARKRVLENFQKIKSVRKIV